VAKLLLADDAPDIRLLVRALFTAEPTIHVVGEAVTPEEAIHQAKVLLPDIVVLHHGFRAS
jgi:DNA-binding NarL/FixJ family response regulator